MHPTPHSTYILTVTLPYHGQCVWACLSIFRGNHTYVRHFIIAVFKFCGRKCIVLVELVSNMASMDGNESLEYRAVLVNLGSIIETLKANKSATDTLCLKCKERAWVGIADDLSPDGLMNVVLNRIKEDVSQYDVFMEFLGSIPGLDLVKDRISNTKCKLLTRYSCSRLWVSRHHSMTVVTCICTHEKVAWFECGYTSTEYNEDVLLVE